MLTVSTDKYTGLTNNVVFTILSQPVKEVNVSVYSPVTKWYEPLMFALSSAHIDKVSKEV